MLFAEACPVLAERLIRNRIFRGLLLGDQEVRAVEREATVVANNAAATVGIGKTGDDVRATCCADARGVDVEHAIVVGLAVPGEDLLDLRIRFLTGFLDRGLHHAPATEGHHRALEGNVGLKADDDVVIFADVASGEGVDVGGGLRIHVVDAAAALLREVLLLEGVPHAKSLVGRTREELGIALVRGVVELDELANVDVLVPVAGLKTAPRVELFALGSGVLFFHSSHVSLPSMAGAKPHAREVCW